MLKIYKNQLLELIEEAGLDPSLFKSSDEPTGHDSRFLRESRFEIEFNDTGHRCYIAVNPKNHHSFRINFTRYNPGFPWSYVEQPQRPIYNSDIKEVKHRFAEWLEEVKLYVEESLTPDLWVRLESEKRLLDPTRLLEIDTSPFEEDEKAQVRLVVGEFRLQLISTFSPSQDQLKLINERLDYLVESTERLNHFDWKSLALNTLIAMTVTLSLDTEKGKLLFELFKKAFAGIVYLLQ